MNLLQQAEQYIFQLHKDTPFQKYAYHNYNHTLRLINGLTELIESEGISESDAEMLYLAGWLHDSGHYHECDCHEIKSSEIAKTFLDEHSYPASRTETVMQLILATQLDHEPQNLLEAAIKDADFKHFADSNYNEISLLLKKEFEFSCNRTISDLEWTISNRDFMLHKHRYYTNYAKQNWHPKKEKNLFDILNRIDKLESDADRITKKELQKKKLERLERPDRGIDTLFRVTLKNHTELSAIADSKANILLSVNAIIISICLSALIPKLDSPSNNHLIYPTFILLLSSVASIIFAILSTRPKITSGTFTKQDMEQRKVNLLFFGNFHKVSLSDYTKSINAVMNDRDYLYDSLVMDLHSLGLVLNRKYKLLRITYSIFMIGILVSVLAFIFAFTSNYSRILVSNLYTQML